ncbi:MAG: NAD-glutamate dehydrogenase [Halieaceae bacterium]
MGWEKGKKKLLHELKQLVASSADAEHAVAVDALAKTFFRSFPSQDLRDVGVDDLYGFIFGAFRALQHWDGGEAKVRIFNPDLEKHGWESNHTVVVIMSRDMPFLLDSARGELNRRTANVHKLHGQNFSLQRDEQDNITAINSERENDVVSLIYFEIDRCTDRAEIDAMRESLQDILAEVASVVDDFSAMREKLAEVIAMVGADTQVEKAQRDESVAFLEWVDQNHMTLLGYECLGVQHSGEQRQVVDIQEARLGLLRDRGTSGRLDLARDIEESAAEGALGRQLTFSKSRIRSRVHRFAYPDYIEVNQFDEQGEVILQHRFMGLYTFSVYSDSPTLIPIVRNKINEVMQLSGLDMSNHEGRELARVLELFPRDELFQGTEEDLYRMATAVNQLQERRKIRLFARPDVHGKFFNCMVYMPRDRYTTEKRIKIQNMLCDALGAQESEFTTFFTESILVRIHFVLLLDPSRRIEYDLLELEQAIVDTTQSWEDRFRERLIEEYGEELGAEYFDQFGAGFPAGYRDAFDPRVAVMDTGRMISVAKGRALEMSFYRMVDEGEDQLRFRLFQRGVSLPLSDVLPILENLGLRVLAETPYGVRDKDGEVYWMQDFSLHYSLGGNIDLDNVRDEFTDAFERIWFGEAESDSFNRLLLGTQMNWREIALLRSYAKYLKQINFGFSTEYIAETLAENFHITGSIVELFLTRFDPQLEGDDSWRSSREQEVLDRVEASLEQVENLGQDRIIRQYLALIQATLRTNFFQTDAEGKSKSYFSFKMQPRDIPDMPKPRPAFEIFVYSPRVEGVHLRGGKVARGGLRWSDRHEDFRTEVLGLVKAQQVKNAVIVPVGAKGGFVCKRQLPNASREELQAEGIACYQIFIRGLLDITDNLVAGEVDPPAQVVRKDPDDTYLVVAADKGTATFSDIANALSEEYGFWLGDAFASGGSVGYDHKKMGITARGAWVSVQRHFREMGINCQETDFTVVGVGDMAGDVFGNGMLLSEHIQLVAAFNHLHIFIDPNPDSAATFPERQRLFAMDRSSWEDFNAELISEGGGIFKRSAKSIPISPQMQERFGIEEKALPPNELITACLKAPVDLLWNGGIGTYVKASTELHADVGDKANDGLRVDGGELRCRVVGEGGNLGLTQLGRVEFALNGGRCNTDFIDNAGGVDCSDHEVNIKILLNSVVTRGDLTAKHRNRLLEEMTDSVSELVLDNNYLQTQAISLAESESAHRAGEYARIIARLEESGRLDRKLEFLPSEEELVERRMAGAGLTRPELSVLVSYSKGILKEELSGSRLPNDSYLSRAIEGAFPPRLLEEYGEEVHGHGLRREIIATQIANDMVNRVGVSFVGRLVGSTGAAIAEVAAAYVTARDIFNLPQQWRAIEALDFQVESSVQTAVQVELVRLMRRACRWLLRNRRHELDPAQAIAEFQPGVAELESALPGLIAGQAANEVRDRYQRLVKQNVDSELAQFVAGSQHLYAAMGIIEAARDSEATALEVAELFFMLGEKLELDWFATQITSAKIENEWQALARDTYLEDLEWQQRSLAVGALKHICEKRDAELCIERWMKQEEALISRWQHMLTDLHAAPAPDFAMFAVANRELLDLAQSSLH